MSLLRITKRCGVEVITTSQLHSSKPELRFCVDINTARGEVKISDNIPGWKQN